MVSGRLQAVVDVKGDSWRRDDEVMIMVVAVMVLTARMAGTRARCSGYCSEEQGIDDGVWCLASARWWL